MSNFELNRMYTIFEATVYNITPIFASGKDPKNSEFPVSELRGTEIIAMWKRLIKFLKVLTNDKEFQSKLEGLIVNKNKKVKTDLSSGRYLLRLEPLEKPIKLATILKREVKPKNKNKRKYEKKYVILLDPRFSEKQPTIDLYFLRYKISLAIPERAVKYDALDLELALKTFLITLKLSGFGKISSKGFGKLKLLNTNTQGIKDENLKEEIEKIAAINITKETLQKLLKELFEVPKDRIMLEEAKVPFSIWSYLGELIANNEYEGYAFNSRKVKDVKVIESEQKNFDELGLSFRELALLQLFYLVRASESKLKAIWKLANGYDIWVSGKHFCTEVLGLPRIARNRRIEPRLRNLKLRSQIKYIPELLPENHDLNVTFMVADYSYQIIDHLPKQLRLCVKDSKEAFKQAFEKLPKIFESGEPWT
jgi:hypothetical protein